MSKSLYFLYGIRNSSKASGELEKEDTVEPTSKLENHSSSLKMEFMGCMDYYSGKFFSI